MKKIKISLCAFLCLGVINTNANGIPVVDTSALSQSVKNYAQMIKDYTQQVQMYEQMIKDTLNFEKQMKELGIDMTEITQILGDINGMIANMKGIYDDITNIPQDILGDVSKITTACSFLSTKSINFKKNYDKVSRIIDNDMNRCTATIRDKKIISDSLNEIYAKIEKTEDYIERQKLRVEAENILAAQRFLEQKTNEENANKMLAFYDTYNKNDKNNPYTKAKMTKDLEDLASQLQKPNNAKQAQALTNGILIKMLENMQRQYELNVEYSNTMLTMAQTQNGNIDFSSALNESSYQQEYKEPELEKSFLFSSDKIDYQYQTDKNGFPIFQVNGKNLN